MLVYDHGTLLHWTTLKSLILQTSFSCLVMSCLFCCHFFSAIVSQWYIRYFYDLLVFIQIGSLYNQQSQGP